MGALDSHGAAAGCYPVGHDHRIAFRGPHPFPRQLLELLEGGLLPGLLRLLQRPRRLARGRDHLLVQVRRRRPEALADIRDSLGVQRSRESVESLGDPFCGLEWRDGRVLPNDQPGLGVTRSSGN